MSISFSKLHQKPDLRKANTKIFAYGCKNDLRTLGFFVATIESKSKVAAGKFYVVNGNSGTLLGYESAMELGIIPTINRLSTDVGEICDEFGDLFQGIGKIKDVKVKIHVDDSVKLNVQPHRRIPFHLQRKVEAELKTHVGLHRYKRLSFGISSAAEIFQETVSESLHGLQGV
ncbi:uncharacterized protein LOC134259974 [Saccostrea cucullata]|uniref:uncharacterized protein LOC134259974 n=1 Tax=Saccostrea cuccullata TaxID=36930 RepID=UPI002ED1ED39